MAFFKFRKGVDGSQAAPPQPESVEGLRRRARHRLIGAAVLVLLGVVGFPILFDTQPRPVAVDIPIEIPDRNKAKPLAAPPAVKAAEAGSSSPAVASAPAPATSVASKAPTSGGPVTLAVPEPPKAVAPLAKADPKPAEAKPAASAPAAASAPKAEPVAKAASKPAVEGERAQALLEGKPVQAGAQDAAAGRFVVQVGAFGDASKAREAQMKLERAGLKNYTHEAETKDGKRIRVRAGPFPTRAEADKAAGKIKELNLPTQILAL